MQIRRTLNAAAWALALGQAGWACAAQAQYPSRPINIIVGYAAGGGNDLAARVVAEEMSKGLKQPVIVENRPGMASITGAAYAARAKPDGYTLFWGASGPLAFNHALYSKLPYKPADFAPISLIAKFPLVLVSNAALPAKNVAELVDYSKRNPDKSNYGSSAAPFQLATELFKSRTGANFTHIPYKGTNESVQAVMAGNVTMTISDPVVVMGQLQGSRLRALAVTSPQRVDFLPGVPTMKEEGVDFEVQLFMGVLAPAGTPPEIVATLNKEIGRALALPDVKAKLANYGCAAYHSSPEEFQRLIESEIPLWTKVARDNNIKLE